MSPKYVSIKNEECKMQNGRRLPTDLFYEPRVKCVNLAISMNRKVRVVKARFNNQ